MLKVVASRRALEMDGSGGDGEICYIQIPCRFYHYLKN